MAMTMTTKVMSEKPDRQRDHANQQTYKNQVEKRKILITHKYTHSTKEKIIKF